MKKTISKNHSSEKKSDSDKNSSDLSSDEEGRTTNENFPGYPHYPTSEDLFNQEMKELELDEEGKPETQKKLSHPPISDQQNEEVSELEKSEADITNEDLRILNDNLNSDLGDDDDLRNREQPIDMSADDLDIPGSELDDDDEEIGEEDEENNSYSIGGDRHEDLEENRS